MTWTLTTSAHHLSHILGFHTRARGTDEGQEDIPNSRGLLFWTIYYLEKTICLRLGCASTIPEFDITVPPPDGGHGNPEVALAMSYSSLAVRTARLAGRVYRDLYCVQALRQPLEYRRQMVQELATELREIQHISNLQKVSPSSLSPHIRVFGTERLIQI
jgi:hypothetical protein